MRVDIKKYWVYNFHRFLRITLNIFVSLRQSIRPAPVVKDQGTKVTHLTGSSTPGTPGRASPSRRRGPRSSPWLHPLKTPVHPSHSVQVPQHSHQKPALILRSVLWGTYFGMHGVQELLSYINSAGGRCFPRLVRSVRTRTQVSDRRNTARQPRAAVAGCVAAHTQLRKGNSRDARYGRWKANAWIKTTCLLKI